MPSIKSVPFRRIITPIDVYYPEFRHLTMPHFNYFYKIMNHSQKQKVQLKCEDLQTDNNGNLLSKPLAESNGTPIVLSCQIICFQGYAYDSILYYLDGNYYYIQLPRYTECQSLREVQPFDFYWPRMLFSRSSVSDSLEWLYDAYEMKPNFIPDFFTRHTE